VQGCTSLGRLSDPFLNSNKSLKVPTLISCVLTGIDFAMNLLNLPPEIVGEIWAYSILVRGMKRGVRLRLVNSEVHFAEFFSHHY
jgi:hypothetical protein